MKNTALNKDSGRFLIAAFIILSLPLLVILSGCTDLLKKDTLNTGSVEPALSKEFQDIPIPEGFKFMPADSYTFTDAKARIAVLVYIGMANAPQAVKFFKDQMPEYNWNFLSEVEHKKHLLTFERESESCIVSIEPRTLNTKITVSLTPIPNK